MVPSDLVRSTCISGTLKVATSYSPKKETCEDWVRGQSCIRVPDLAKELQTNQLGALKNQMGRSPPQLHWPTRLWAVKTNFILLCNGFKISALLPNLVKTGSNLSLEVVSPKAKIPIAKLTQNPNPMSRYD